MFVFQRPYRPTGFVSSRTAISFGTRATHFRRIDIFYNKCLAVVNPIRSCVSPTCLLTRLTVSSRCRQLLTKQRLHELVKEVDPNEQLDEEVEELLLQLADDFIESTVSTACQLAKHRKAATVDVKDVQLYLGQSPRQVGAFGWYYLSLIWVCAYLLPRASQLLQSSPHLGLLLSFSWPNFWFESPSLETERFSSTIYTINLAATLPQIPISL